MYFQITLHISYVHAAVNPLLFMALHRALRRAALQLCCGCCVHWSQFVLALTAAGKYNSFFPIFTINNAKTVPFLSPFKIIFIIKFELSTHHTTPSQCYCNFSPLASMPIPMGIELVACNWFQTSAPQKTPSWMYPYYNLKFQQLVPAQSPLAPSSFSPAAASPEPPPAPPPPMAPPAPAVPAPPGPPTPHTMMVITSYM